MGDEMLFITPRGGGYGEPLDRDSQLVLKDFVEEYMTADEAAEVYGVRMDPEKRAVDSVGTETLRRARV